MGSGRIKKRLCIGILMLGIGAMGVFMEETVYAEVASGTIGDSVTWTFDSDTGVLAFDGEGSALNFRAGDYSEQITEVYIGAGITEISTVGTKYIRNLFLPNVQKYVVDSENQNYASENGVVFNKDKTQILLFPRARTGSYTIPDTVTEIETAFTHSSLEHVIIPDSVEKIGADAFSHTGNLEEIVIPDSVEYIGEDAFGYSGIKNIEIPDGVELRNYPFRNSALESVIIGRNVTCTGSYKYVFEECDNLTDVEVASDVWEYMFYKCPNVKNINLKEGVTKISQYAFEECPSPDAIVFPDSLKVIEGYAFPDTVFENIYITKNIQSISNASFGGVSSYTVDESNPYLVAENGILFSKDKSTLVAYPKGKTDSTVYHIPEYVKTIQSSAFYGCSVLEKITIPMGVAKIDYDTFRDCTSLKYMVIPDGVTEINGGAFWNCTSLESVVLPKTATGLNKGMQAGIFDGCTNLKDIYGYTGTDTENYAGTYFISLDSGVKVHFAPNGGSLADDWKKVYPTGVYGELPVPTRAGYSFEGWYTVASGGDRITSDTLVREVGNHILYAHWTAIPNDTPDDTMQSGNQTGNTDSENSVVPAQPQVQKPSQSAESDTSQQTNPVTKPAATKITVKKVSAKAIKVSWSKVEGADGYTIYRATSKNGAYKECTNVDSSTLSWKNTTLKKGYVYYYKVSAYKMTGNGKIYSDSSNVAGKLLADKPATPKQKKISFHQNKKTFTISWKPVKKATKIVILRKAGNGKYKAWKTVSASKGKATYSYAKYARGKKYSFCLKAYYVVAGKKVYSGESNGYTIRR